MRQLGNLAIVCAGRSDVLLQIFQGQVTVHVGRGPQRYFMERGMMMKKSVA